jgi:hypothetical protein
MPPRSGDDIVALPPEGAPESVKLREARTERIRLMRELADRNPHHHLPVKASYSPIAGRS